MLLIHDAWTGFYECKIVLRCNNVFQWLLFKTLVLHIRATFCFLFLNFHFSVSSGPQHEPA